MSEMRTIVDHLKLEYNGLFDVKELFNFIDAWWMERGMEKRTTKNFEINTLTGKFIEWQSTTWTKMGESQNLLIRIRILIYNMRKVEATQNNKKLKINEGKVITYIDGFIHEDYRDEWDEKPLFIFLRTLRSKFFLRAYTEWFEHVLIQRVHNLYNSLEKFFNVYSHYRVVSNVPSFYNPFEAR